MTKRLAVICALGLVACGGGATKSNERTGSTEVAVTSETSLSVSPRSPAESFAEFLTGSGVTKSSGVIDHGCGEIAFVEVPGKSKLISWVANSWQTVQLFDFEAEEVLPSVASVWTSDVTGDGEPEVVISWSQEGSDQTFGGVLHADVGKCDWQLATFIDGCDQGVWLGDLALPDDSSLTGRAFMDCAYGEDEVQLVWNQELEVFLARPVSGDRYCRSLTENFDLPLISCNKGWAVQMAQEAIAGAGFDVDVDGQFGPGTQMAVLLFQQRAGIPLSGVIDEPTWAAIYPVGGPDGTNMVEYPDFDGDGISSPREIGDASGSVDVGDF